MRDSGCGIIIYLSVTNGKEFQMYIHTVGYMTKSHCT